MPANLSENRKEVVGVFKNRLNAIKQHNISENVLNQNNYNLRYFYCIYNFIYCYFHAVYPL